MLLHPAWGCRPSAGWSSITRRPILLSIHDHVVFQLFSDFIWKCWVIFTFKSTIWVRYCRRSSVHWPNVHWPTKAQRLPHNTWWPEWACSNSWEHVVTHVTSPCHSVWKYDSDMMTITCFYWSTQSAPEVSVIYIIYIFQMYLSQYSARPEDHFVS